VEYHLSAEDFERLLGRCPQPSHAESNALIVRHLLTDCPACGRTLQELRGGRALLSRLLEVPLPQENPESPASQPFNYDWAFARAERTFAALLAHGRPPEHLPERLAELASLPEREQLRRVGANDRFANPDLIHCLLERSHAARYQSPRKTLHLAHLARAAAEACTPEAAGGVGSLADLRAETCGAFANAERICGNLTEAERFFALAFQFQKAGTGAPRLRALLLSQLSSLRLFQRHFQDTIKLAEKSATIYCGLGEDHLVAGVMVQQATALLYCGDVESAVETLQRAIPGIDRSEDPRLFLAAQHNLARCYIDLDRPEEALAVHFNARELYRECPDPLILLRAIWQEGQLLREIGHLHNAEAALLRAREGFMEHRLAYEAGSVSLDLAEVYSKLGLTAKLRQTIAEAVPIFRALQVDREVVASLLRLQQAASEAPEEKTG